MSPSARILVIAAALLLASDVTSNVVNAAKSSTITCAEAKYPGADKLCSGDLFTQGADVNAKVQNLTGLLKATDYFKQFRGDVGLAPTWF